MEQFSQIFTITSRIHWFKFQMSQVPNKNYCIHGWKYIIPLCGIKYLSFHINPSKLSSFHVHSRNMIFRTLNFLQSIGSYLRMLYITPLECIKNYFLISEQPNSRLRRNILKQHEALRAYFNTYYKKKIYIKFYWQKLVNASIFSEILNLILQFRFSML